jgi:hypothetical protein
MVAGEGGDDRPAGEDLRAGGDPVERSRPRHPPARLSVGRSGRLGVGDVDGLLDAQVQHRADEEQVVDRRPLTALDPLHGVQRDAGGRGDVVLLPPPGTAPVGDVAGDRLPPLVGLAQRPRLDVGVVAERPRVARARRRRRRRRRRVRLRGDPAAGARPGRAEVLVPRARRRRRAAARAGSPVLSSCS